MFRTAPRLIARQAARPALQAHISTPTRRFLSTAPPAQKRRSWKSLVARLGLAGAVVYYYNTTDLFADDVPVHTRSSTGETEASALPTLESIAAERAQRRAVEQHLALQREKEAAAAEARPELAAQDNEDAAPREGGIEGLQAEADQQGAFNPETGEINWDCPCLGGMATGPCGEEFKAAFSCFVYSQEEPKGMDCIDKFKDMQNCFRQYPEIYGSEIDNDDDEDDMTADAAADVSTNAPAEESASKEPAKNESKSALSGPHDQAKVDENRRELGLVPENYRTAEKEAERE